jgi:CRP-like cAMP-binding protein
MAKSPNRLLASLSSEVFSALAPQLKTVELRFGDVVAEAGAPTRRVYFPYAGVISLVVELDVGAMIETAMVGRDGFMNAASALDGRVSLNKGIVQMAGSAGTLEVDQLRRLANEFGVFRSLLIRHEQVLFAQSQQSAACNASHTVEARMCRWLLHMRDLADGDDLVLTQDFLAQMLACGGQACRSWPIRCKGGLDQIPSRPYSRAGRQWIKKRRLRVLRHRQGSLPEASFGLAT